jgi:hypothetical protein
MRSEHAKDSHPRASDAPGAAERKRKKGGALPKKVAGKPQGPASRQKGGEGLDDFPGTPRKSTKKDAGFEPDADVEAGHEDEDRAGSRES